jgi:hypothetical protein
MCRMAFRGYTSGIRFGALGLIFGGFKSLHCATSHIDHLGPFPTQTGSHEPAGALL